MFEIHPCYCLSSFLPLSSILVYKYIQICFFGLFWFSYYELTFYCGFSCMNMHLRFFFCRHIFLFLLEMYLQVELGGQSRCMFNFVRNFKKFFSKSLYSFFYSSTSHIWYYSISSLKIFAVSPFDVAILEHMQFYIFMVLIYISLMVFSNLLCAYWPFIHLYL